MSRHIKPFQTLVEGIGGTGTAEEAWRSWYVCSCSSSRLGFFSLGIFPHLCEGLLWPSCGAQVNGHDPCRKAPYYQMLHFCDLYLMAWNELKSPWTINYDHLIMDWYNGGFSIVKVVLKFVKMGTWAPGSCASSASRGSSAASGAPPRAGASPSGSGPDMTRTPVCWENMFWSLWYCFPQYGIVFQYINI